MTSRSIEEVSRRNWITLAGLTVLSGLVSPAVTFAKTQKQNYLRHGSDKKGFFSNSYLLEGSDECLLIDTHLNRDEALELSALVAATGKPLSTIIITHPHPDHYLGLEYIAPLHPAAEVLSSKRALEVVSIASSGWRGFRNSLRRLESGPVTLSGHQFECLLPPDAESIAPVVLYEQKSGTLISGDHVLNGQHLWLVEGRTNAWKNNLEQISNKWVINLVLPGHGEIGGSNLIDQTHQYLSRFQALIERGSTSDQARQSMLEFYPDHLFVEALDNSILANF